MKDSNARPETMKVLEENLRKMLLDVALGGEFFGFDTRAQATKTEIHKWDSGKGKSEPHRDATSHLSEWLVSKREEITGVGEDVEEREAARAFGRNVDWCSQYGKQHGDPLRN